MPSLFSGGPLGQRPLTPITTQQRFRRLLVNWVADSDIPFRVVEHQYFRDLLSILNTDQTDCLLPKSQNTLRAWMRTEYEIHLYTIKSALLATPYPILLAHLNPHLPPAQIQYLQFIRRVRCLGHILNLVARAFLDDEDKETINRLAKGSAERLSAEQERELLIAWRETGLVGKLHYLVHFARRTPQRRDAFTDFTRGSLSSDEVADVGALLVDPAVRNLRLKADNDTRWHSVYHMIERALHLRDPLTRFSARYNRLGDLADEAILTSEDWVVLAEMKATIPGLSLGLLFMMTSRFLLSLASSQASNTPSISSRSISRY